jgi:hypothetical protein
VQKKKRVREQHMTQQYDHLYGIIRNTVLEVRSGLVSVMCVLCGVAAGLDSQKGIPGERRNCNSDRPDFTSLAFACSSRALFFEGTLQG